MVDKIKIPSVVVCEGYVCQVMVVPIHPYTGSDSPFIPEVEE